MTILILAPGSRGDVAPIMGVAAGLVADGHRVLVVAHADYGPLVAQAACELVPFDVPMAPSAEDGGNPGVRAHLAQLREYMSAAADAALRAAGNCGDEIRAVLTNPISPYGHDLAEALGAASAEALLQPMFPSGAYPPMTFSSLAGGPRRNKLLGHIAERMPSPVNAARARVTRELGLQPEKPAAARRRRLLAGLPVHHGIDSAVLPRPADWPAPLTLDGFWWPQEPPDWQPPAELTGFLDAGEPPVLVTLGSVEADTRTAGAVREFVNGSRARVIVQGTGWEELVAELQGRVLAIGDVPHSWLIPRAAAVVHQAGAGVTAACLRAGVPSVPVPQHTDQFFWAGRAVELGAAVSPGRTRAITAEALSGAVAKASETRDYREAAQHVSRSLTSADSTAPIRDWAARVVGGAAS